MWQPAESARIPDRLKFLLQENADRIAEAISAEHGKTHDDALGEVTRRRRRVDHVRTKFSVSERLACRVLGQHRSTQGKTPRGRADDAALTADIVALATECGRYGYRHRLGQSHGQDRLGPAQEWPCR
ncbi:hypothetical protein FJM51_07585 [Amaricoccus solimangrovi]|uniref:Uncharacterized protein n=1 Tax=Amaricoccus solimangrovi TaxID=2589815 RepID=A0A501WUN9_9RHOB|nr:hypothetical protein FJM51_07585 [Amaricoccus solimangrovi]